LIYLKLIASFIKISMLSIGGGYAMIPLIQREVENFNISQQEFVDIIAIAEMTPGPIGLNASTYTGYKVAGIAGSVVSTFANVLPAFVLALIVSKLLHVFRGSRLVDEFFRNFRPLVIGLIAAAAIIMAEAVKLYGDYKGLAIFIAVFVVVYRLRSNPILAIIGAGLLGIVVY
jgi:chromate transporter